MAISSHTDRDRGIVKQAFLELLDERRDVLQELFAKVLEDLALARAIKEGLRSETIDRSDVIA